MKFRKKPVVVEAYQFREADYWQGGTPEGMAARLPGVFIGGVPSGGTFLYVVTAHGKETPIADGDWIIAEPDGRGYYPCKADIFAATYEPVEGQT